MTFEVHGSKLKRDPLRNTGQASILGITHGVFFLGVGKDPFNGLFAHGIQAFADIRFTYLLHNIHGILPNVAVYHLLTIGTGSALLSARTVPANLRGAAVGPLPPLSVVVCRRTCPCGQISRSFSSS